MIIDFHAHIFPPWFIAQRERYIERDATFGELYADPKAKMASAEDLIQAMDEDHVDKTIVMGIGWTDYDLAQEVNNYIIESVRAHPERLIGFAGISPAWDDKAVAEAERCAKEGLRGIGELHPDSQGFDLGNYEAMAPLMDVADKHNLIITTHSSEPVGHIYQGKGKTRPEVLWRFIENFQKATIVCAHWGGGLPFYALMPEVKESLTNVYFDTAASPFLYTPDVFHTVAELIGADKILLGSDYPLLRTRRVIKQVTESELSDADKEAILGGNAARLLNM